MHEQTLQLLPQRGFFVSCQVAEGSPMRDAELLARLAHAAVAAGADGIRANGPEDVRAIVDRVDAPVIGIAKRHVHGYSVFITPSFEDAEPLVDAGAKIVALDGTPRPRPAEPLEELIAAVHELGAVVMADVDDGEAGRFARDAGADIVATTLAGYTGGTVPAGPDLDLVSELAGSLDCPIVAEGRYWTPGEVAAAYERGARAVVVGSAVTNVERIVARFLEGSRA